MLKPICKHNTTCCQNVLPRSPSATTDGDETAIILKYSTRPLLVTGMPVCLLLTSPCGLVHIQPITGWGAARGMFPRYWGGEGAGAPRTSTQSSVFSRSQEQIMSNDCVSIQFRRAQISKRILFWLTRKIFCPSITALHIHRSATPKHVLEGQLCLPPRAIAQAFCSKSTDFGTFEIYPKSSPTIWKVVGNPFASK